MKYYNKNPKRAILVYFGGISLCLYCGFLYDIFVKPAIQVTADLVEAIFPPKLPAIEPEEGK